MDRQGYLFAIAAFGIVSGLFSPLASVMLFALIGLAPALLAPAAGIVLMINAILTATLTIMVGGIPAAIHERITGRAETDATGWLLWLAGTVVVALPALAKATAIMLG